MPAGTPLSSRSALVLLLCALGVALPTRADEIYRWVDAEGKVHFGATPPAGGGAPAEEWQPADDRQISVVPELDAPDAPAPQQARPTPPSAAAPPARVSGLGEGAWRKRARDHAQRVEQVESAIEQLEESLSFPSRYRDSMSQAAWEHRQERRLDELRGELERAEDELEEFEADAQQRGVPAAWLD